MRQLLDGQALGMALAELYHFRDNEKIFVLGHWDQLKRAPRLIMVTSLGYVRGFPTNVMVNAIEAPVPWSFDNPLPGWWKTASTASLLPGIIPIAPQDVLDLKLLHIRDNAVIVDTWTL